MPLDFLIFLCYITLILNYGIFMKLNFTKKEFYELVKLASIGEWICGSVNDGTESASIRLLNHLFENANEFGFDNLSYVDNESNNHIPTREFEADIFSVLDTYDEFTFIEKLSSKLGTRDFILDLGKDVIEKMDESEIIKKSGEYIDFYRKEILQGGINNLFLKINKDNL